MPSAKVLDEKKNAVAELTEEIKAAKGIVFADYRGLTVEEDTELRNELRKEGVKYRVIKNSLAKFATKNCGLEGLEDSLKGPTAMALHTEDVVAPAKIVSKYAKKYKQLEIKAGVIEGDIADLAQIKQLADLPSKEELVAKVVGGFNTPIAGLVYALNGNIQGLAVALNAIAEKKQAEA